MVLAITPRNYLIKALGYTSTASNESLATTSSRATIRITDERALGQGMIQLVGTNGQMLFSNDVFIESMDQLIQVPLPSNIASGLYIVSFRIHEQTVTEKFFIRGE